MTEFFFLLNYHCLSILLHHVTIENEIHLVAFSGWKKGKLVQSSSLNEMKLSSGNDRERKQGRIHSYFSRVRVGRGYIWGH